MMRGSPFELSSVALSDLGLKRKNNEDSTLILPQFGVFAVADGMGGADAGEVASDKVVRFIDDAMHNADGASAGTLSQKCRIVTKALKDASDWIWRYAREQNLRSCGTTVVALVFDARGSERAMVLHAGDSRAYRFRAGVLDQITRDHSFAEASGVADAKLLPARLQGVITRAVGIAQNVGVDETGVTVVANDVFLLCSDGLSSMVSNFRIQEILRESEGESLDESVRRLIGEANHSGGHDNVSVVMVRVEPQLKATADLPTSTEVDGGMAVPARTVTMPHDLQKKTGPCGAGRDFEPRPDTLGIGFSTIVRLGLGVIAILLLLLILLTIADRRQKILTTTRQRVEKTEDKAMEVDAGQAGDYAVPAIVGEESEAGTIKSWPDENGMLPIPADTEPVIQPVPVVPQESPSVTGSGAVTNETVDKGL